jgi:hypothetical protein
MTFDINNLVSKYQDKNFIDILSELTKEVNHLDNLHRNIKKHKDISEYQFQEYRKYAGDFLYFLNTGGTPAGIGIDGLKKFLPIITNLVDKGQLKKDVLERFQQQG